MTPSWARNPSDEVLTQLRTLYVEWVALERDPDRIVAILVQTRDGHALPAEPICAADDFIAFLGPNAPAALAQRLRGPTPAGKTWLVVIDRDDLSRLALAWLDVPTLDPNIFRALRGREVRDPLDADERRVVRTAFDTHVAGGGDADSVILLMNVDGALQLVPERAFVPRAKFIAERWLHLPRLLNRIAEAPQRGFVWVVEVRPDDRATIFQMPLNDS
jgi:hypothetical protein